MLRLTPTAWWLGAGLLAAAPAALADTLTVHFDEDEKTVNLYDVFTMEIRADNLQDVIGWGLDLTNVARGVISLIDIDITSPWIPANGLDGDGLCAVASPFFGPINGSDILIATLTFEADMLGDAPLELSETEGDLTEGWPTSGEPGSFTAATYVDGLVHVVPEPATIGLLALGVLALRRRR